MQYSHEHVRKEGSTAYENLSGKQLQTEMGVLPLAYSSNPGTRSGGASASSDGSREEQARAD